ncbi:pyruvate kinase [Neobacillus drentensis]|uniref:pyruvate kinase n=1 Tax=Neobacillus drentensis TaxID=220684 RepID=UPI001F24B58E|nr:pyruvate kinase [Neobacillus drentensis]ULT54613.1 pyruvate kinase [Neobacillus drentensis]
MVEFPLNQQELAQRLENIYKQIIQSSYHLVDPHDLQGDARMCRDNLISYLVLREQHLLSLRQELTNKGLADLMQSPEHLLYTLEKIVGYLPISLPSQKNLLVPTPDESSKILTKRTNELFGNRMNQPAIMVTVDSKVLNNPSQIEELLRNGMDVARINCAHDDQDIWKDLIDAIRDVEKKLRLEGNYHKNDCKIYMDLAGPKVRVGKLPAAPILVMKGDRLRLYLNSEASGHPALENTPAGVPVTLEKAFRNVRVNDSIFIDDGKIRGFVTQVTKEIVEVEIDSPALKPIRIKEGKGLNLPDSLLSLNLPALTKKDLADIPFITKHADIVGISFVHSPLDLRKLRQELDILNRTDMGVVAKIETKDAIHNLARIILEGLHFKRFGIMLARGDLAVEVGLENLSFVQDEILTICSAAYTPVIWATGVLEKLTKKGIPTRAEMTDAAYGTRANCIMLNKGAFVIDAVKMLVKIVNTGVVDPPRQKQQLDLTSQYGIFDPKSKS